MVFRDMMRARTGRSLLCAVGWLGVALPAAAQEGEQDLEFADDVPAEGDYFVIPFEVPEGTVEIQVSHDDRSEDNILDWGLMGPEGFRGYGGGNTQDAIVGEQAASRSYLPGPITPGTWHVYVGKAKIVEEPAEYEVKVTLRDETATLELEPQPERTPYEPVAPLSTEARWYAGDFHVHSSESGDASASLEDIALFAEGRGLDFVMLSDHNTVSQLELYAEAQQAHPDLLFVPGIEVTTYQGHANAMGATEWIDHRLGYEGLTADAVAEATHAQGALFAITHPGLDVGDLCIGCAWRAPIDDDEVDGLEIQTGAYDVTGALLFDPAVTFWEDMAIAGHHVTAVGGSDDHRAGTGTGAFDSPIGSPTTMVWAEELSADGILEGVRNGRTVVKLQGPDDPMLEIWPEQPLSGDTVVADRLDLRVRVTGGNGTTLYLVENGMRGEAIPVMGDPFEVERTVTAPPSGESFIRAELEMLGQPRVVTSHVFLQPATPGGGRESGGGGCAVAPDGPTSLPWLAAGFALVAFALFVRRRG
ncbi:MAG: CehA/McbA family metallohydrolase [Myxococcota bacterium]